MKCTKKELIMMEAHGYKAEYNTKTGISFSKQNRRVWGMNPLTNHKFIQTADIIDGVYRNHLAVANLREAAARPLWTTEEAQQ